MMQANGVLAYFTTLALFLAGWQLKLFSPARVYDLFGELLAGLNIFSLLFCLFLYFKVHCSAPPSWLTLKATTCPSAIAATGLLMATLLPLISQMLPQVMSWSCHYSRVDP